MSSEKSTLEMCQVWVHASGRVVKVVRGSTPIEEYAGKEFLDIKPLLEADGWKETARFNVADAPDQIQVAYRRSKVSS